MACDAQLAFASPGQLSEGGNVRQFVRWRFFRYGLIFQGEGNAGENSFRGEYFCGLD